MAHPLTPDLTHAQHRIAVGPDPTADRHPDHWGGQPLSAAAHQHHRILAGIYVDHLRRGGPAALLLHEAKAGGHGAIDPWRLLEHVAALTVTRPSEAPEADAAEAAGVPGEHADGVSPPETQESDGEVPAAAG